VRVTELQLLQIDGSRKGAREPRDAHMAGSHAGRDVLKPDPAPEVLPAIRSAPTSATTESSTEPTIQEVMRKPRRIRMPRRANVDLEAIVAGAR